jgi:archaellum biogenesis protein FlaJ (TadC family)
LTEKQPDLADIILRITKEKKPETVNQLALLIREANPASEQEILDAIIKLQNDGKLKLTRHPQYPLLSLSAYLKTYDAAWYWTTFALTLASIAAIFTIPENLQPYVIIRYTLGIIFILWLPGYTLIKALFPQAPPTKPTTGLTNTIQNMDTIERIALSIGLSLALVPIIGLLLNYTPWGIRLTPITLSLAALTLIFATAAILRENQNRKKPKT